MTGPDRGRLARAEPVDAPDPKVRDDRRAGPEIGALANSRRFNLQETFVRAVYDLVAARRGVTALRVSTRKPDIYPDCAGVGVDLASF